jgi:hypothetical protein
MLAGASMQVKLRDAVRSDRWIQLALPRCRSGHARAPAKLLPDSVAVTKDSATHLEDTGTLGRDCTGLNWTTDLKTLNWK